MIKMVRKASFSFILCLMISCSGKGQTTVSSITASTEKHSDTTDNYIGLKYPPLPRPIKTSTSWQHAIYSSSLLWGVDTIMDEKSIMLWLSKTVAYDDESHAIFQVNDIVFLPLSARDKDVVVSGCVIAGQLDYEIVALVNLDKESLDNRWLPNSNIISAWRANQSTGKFEKMNTEKIECQAETFLDFP